MKGWPVSARMSDAGGPFLLKGFGVLGHTQFIELDPKNNEFNLNFSVFEVQQMKH